MTVVDAAGRIAMGGAAITLRDTVRELAAQDHKKVVVNLADVLYIDSAGVGELVAVLTGLINRGGSRKLLNANERMRSILEITKLNGVFQIFDDKGAAVNSFG